MATIQELLNEAAEIRDAELDQENTALRVGTMFVNIIQYLTSLITSDAAINAIGDALTDYFVDGELKQTALPQAFMSSLSEWAEGVAEKETSTQLLKLIHSRIIILDSMGSTLDGLDYTPVAGDLVWRLGYVWKYNGSEYEQGGVPPRPHVVYLNKHTGKSYMWNGSAMVEVGNHYEDIIQISQMDQTDVANIPIGKLHYIPSQSKLVYRISNSKTHSWTPRTDLVYVDISNNTLYRWQGSSFQKVSSNAEVVNNLTDGGEDAALSAEMGKELAAQMGALEETMEDLEDGAGYEISVVGDAIVFTSRNAPRVIVGAVGNNNLQSKAGNTATTSFYVSGRNLASAISIAVTGNDSANWEVSPTSISPGFNGKVGLTLVTITYKPAAGTTAGTSHSCNVVVSSGGTTFGTTDMQGTVVAAPSIVLTPATLNISTPQGTSGTATLNVKGAALEGDIALTIEGTGFTLSANSVQKEDAERDEGADITVTFDGSTAGSATIKANSTNATEVTATVNGVIPTPLAVGSYFDIPLTGGGALRYTVLSGVNVEVAQLSYNSALPSSTIESPLIIPATVKDSDAVSVKNSGGTTISASGLTYNVTTVKNVGFKNNSNLKSVILSEGITTIKNEAFYGSGLQYISLPSTFTTFASGARYFFYGCTSLAEIEFKSNAQIVGECFNGCNNLMKIILNGNTFKNNAFYGCTQFTATSGTKPVVINRKTTAYTYAANSGVVPFPVNSSSKVWATLYCPDVSGYNSNGWSVFDEVLDINNYSE